MLSSNKDRYRLIKSITFLVLLLTCFICVLREYQLRQKIPLKIQSSSQQYSVPIHLHSLQKSECVCVHICYCIAVQYKGLEGYILIA